MNRREQLLSRLEKSWRGFLDAYAGMTDSELLKPGVTGSWSVRDIIAHVTTWEEEALKYLPLVLSGGTLPRYSVTHGGIDAFNAKTTQQKQDLSLSEVLRQRDAVHEQLVKFIEGVPDNQLGGRTRFRHRLRADTYSHYPKHAQAIRSWRERMSKAL